ncbi:MAG TPA: phosphatase domain-containing protein [Bacteriovoracaceae bacterium]|nr:phosphatase domain-containing protein [Bacteriovoracaceae bacterium]
MRRPKLVHFTGIESDEYIHIRASMTYSSHGKFEILDEINQNLKEIVPTRPIQSLGLLSSNVFRLKVIGLSREDEEVTIRFFDSDSFGNFNFKLPQPEVVKIVKLKLFETNSHPGLELLIGSFIPTTIRKPKKIIITDFDKTLVDTRYSSMKELYHSLRNPIQYFPPVDKSIELITGYIREEYQPFVVSASPHFYENAIRDWLYQRQIFTGNIFLKDYRNIFSFFEGDLSTKDLKSQGFYKLNTIVNILLMTGIPEDLVLVGDGFESDTIIYLTLAAVLIGRYDPWTIWNSIKREESFRLTNQQHFRFLSKFYQLKNMSDARPRSNLKIYIRCKPKMQQTLDSRNFNLDFANQLKHLVHNYVG